MPRQSIRTDEMVESILAQLADGIPLAEICRQDGMPHPSTWLDWVNADENLAIAYGRARENGEDRIAADCMAIADDARNDWMERFDEEGGNIGYKLNGEHVQRSKLRIETRLKLLAKWNPKKYGDRQLVGSDPENPLPSGLQVVFTKGSEK